MAHIIKAYVALPVSAVQLKLQLHLTEQGVLRAAFPAGEVEGREISYAHFCDLPVQLEGSPFQKQVWAAVCRIPRGETRSYQWVANRVGRASAVRAVARAIGANPILVRIPCHRVIYASGALGGFAFGMHLKKVLLGWEGVFDFVD